MNRWTWFTVCVSLALLMLVCGWLMPVHLRGVEAPVLKQAGRSTMTLTAHGLELLRAGQFGAAELISRAAGAAKLPSANELASAVESTAKQYPVTKVWGVADPGLKTYFAADPASGESNKLAFTDFVVREENRNKALEVLRVSRQPAVQELLQSRALTNTTTFAPSQSAGGEAFDTAVVIGGLLLEQGKLTAGLSNEIHSAAAQANRGGNTEQLEQALLDFLSLGQRFNWGQLVSFVGKTDAAATLHEQADLVRGAGDQLPELFSAVELSGNPKGVTQYLRTFHESGLKDLAAAFPYKTGGVQELLRLNQRLYNSHWRQIASEYNPFAAIVSLTADSCWRMPQIVLILKWFLYFGGGFLLAMALHFGRPAVPALEEPLQVRGFHLARETLFALGFLLVVLLLSEPFLAREGTTTVLPFRLRVPTVGSVVQPGNPDTKTSFMDKSNFLPILFFFVLQALLYVACVVKLAEIQRQRVNPRVKLKFLENEEHLFDGGLYLGFLGTIISFIVYSVYARHQFSLMVAYSSTSFGILFVSFFKIFHLRPARRRLLLEAEAESAGVATHTTATSLAS